jgi:hypothetical protein
MGKEYGGRRERDKGMEERKKKDEGEKDVKQRRQDV